VGGQVELLKADVFRIFLLVPTVVTSTLASRTQARLATIRTSGDTQEDDEYMEPEIVVCGRGGRVQGYICLLGDCPSNCPPPVTHTPSAHHYPLAGAHMGF
jgi:hypothetical protein